MRDALRRPPSVAAATRRRPCSSLAASGQAVRAFSISFTGDEADAAAVVIDHQQLLDPALVQQPLAPRCGYGVPQLDGQLRSSCVIRS
jgi:hypothetical protein